MKLSVKSEYAARAVLGLARHYQKGGSVRGDALAEENGIPANYLVQILIELKAQQIVRSQRGKEGGYALAKPPAEISLGDVLRCVNGKIFDPPGATETASPAELRNAWKSMQEAVNAAADGISFQAMLDEGVNKEKMYYI